MKIKKIGIIGTGNISIDHASVATHIGAKVVAGSCSSRNSKKWEEFHKRYPETTYFDDSRDLINDPNIEGLICCLPWDIQPNWLKYLLASSKPILIEKPVSIEFNKLSILLQKPGIFVDNKLIGFNRRYYNTVAHLKNRIKRGGLISAEIVISEDLERLVKRRNKNILNYVLETSSSCHILDLANHIFGELKIVASYSHTNSCSSKSSLSLNGLFENKDKKPIFYSINSNDPSRVGISCRFEDDTKWDLKPIEKLTVYKGYKVQDRTPEVQVRRYQPNVINELIEDSMYNPGFLKQMNAFVSGEYGPGANLIDSLNLLKLISKIK